MPLRLPHRAWSLVLFLALSFLTSRRASAGYSHYWQWQKPADATRVAAAIADMRVIAASRRDLVVFEEHPGAITINGIGPGAHEPLQFPSMSLPGAQGDRRRGFNFVKTQSKPYDAVVTACLLAARAHFGADELAIASDGEDSDWDVGREVYAKALGRAPPAIELSSTNDFSIAPILGASPWRWLFVLPTLLTPLLAIGMLWLLFNRGREGSGWTYLGFWFLAPVVVSTLVSRPYILIIVPVAIVLRRWLPDPVLWLATRGRIRALEATTLVNPANLTARRDLAKLWLARGRGKKALIVVDEALARDPSSAELHFLRGLALLRIGDFERAIPELAESVQIDPRFGYGEPYLRCGDALLALKRWDDAEDALERFVEIHVSNVEGWYKLAHVRRMRGDRAGARAALREARSGYRFARGAHRRAYFGWYAKAVVRSAVG